MADGHLNFCKGCTTAYDKKRRSEHPEKLREYEQRRGETDERRANVKLYAETTKQRYPKRRAAHIKLGNSLRDGKIERYPCWVCEETKVEAHHPDYDSPLDVVWLCVAHHKELHKEMPQ